MMEPGSVEKNDDINQDIINNEKKNDGIDEDVVDKPEKSNNLTENNLENIGTDIDTSNTNQTSIKDTSKNLDSPMDENVMEAIESSETTLLQTSSNECINQKEVPMEVDQDEVLECVDETISSKESLEIVGEENQIETSEKVNEDQISDKEKNIDSCTEVCNDKSDNGSKEGINIEVSGNEEISSEDVGNLVSIEHSSNSQEQNFTKKDSVESTKEPLQNDASSSIQECVDVDMENKSEKKTQSEVVDEVEKPEFVQLNQEREDSQSSFSRLENQADAENDPFEGDNLSTHTDSVEAMEVDSGKSNKNVTASEETDLRNLVSEKDKDVSPTDKNQEKENNQNKEISSESKNARAESPNLLLEKTSNTSPEKLVDTSLESSSEKTSTALLEKSSESSSKKSTGVSENSASTTLPGQDDELCIIPDSTKEKSVKEKSMEDLSKELDKEKNLTPNDEEKSDTLEKNENAEKTKVPESKDETSKSTLKVAALTTDSNDIVTVDKSPEGPSILTSDIIDIEDDGKTPEIEEISSKEVCKQCKVEKPCLVKVKVGTKNYTVCSDECKSAFITENNKATDIPSEGVNSKKEKRCANCLLIVEAKDERNLSWETMEFCNEECLGKFQTKYGSYCRNCNGAVQSVSLGKYCVRFGYDVRQFCCSTCLEEFKKGLKVCSFCQKDISAGTEGFLAPVGDKGQFKDFCTQDCMEKYSKMNSTEPPVQEKKVCSVCQEEKVMHCEVQIDRNPSVPICSEPCFAAFKFVNKVDPDQCSTCKKYFQLPTKNGFVVFYEDEAHTFCNKTCLNVFIIQNRKIVPCNWCKVKKYNFDMIKKELKTGQVMMMCSLNCLTLYQVSINAVSARRINCDFCKEFSQAQYHLTMSDATIRNFCSYNCVMKFQAQYTKSPITIPTSDSGAAVSTDPVPTGIPKRAIGPVTMPQLPRSTLSQDPATKKTMPVISSVTSLAASMANGQPGTVQIGTTQATIGGTLQPITLHGNSPVIYKQQVVTRPTSPVAQGNKMTQCKPLTHTKGVSVRPVPCHRETQTEVEDKLIVPLPVPIFIPFPVHMYSMPFPVPVPIPIPVPVPIFIPTTRNSTKGIFKEFKRIQEKIPSDPFEAELLMMAEMVATDKKNDSDSDSDGEARDDGDANDSAAGDSYSPEVADSTNTFGDDMLQMALKMATGEMDETAVDLETALTPSTIQTPQRAAQNENTENDAPREKTHSSRGRKRGGSLNKSRSIPHKRARRSISANNNTMLSSSDNQNTVSNRFDPSEKPDANMALKYTFGVNAWRQWVITKNAELEKQSTPTRKLKPFKTDLLQLTADELNYSLCLFVKEVRKPSGAEYAPDTIYYLCLGIQQYLFENNRIDNIFTDAYYEKFTDCLDEVARKFSTVFNDALYVVTRVEEEHLWECKQLGAHSPHVLLNTLMYFNTKHFNLVTVDEHMQLSFSHIMKHWKRNTSAGLTPNSKGPASRNILLRFYPPQSALEANTKKKKVYEQQENEENPLRCPVKLYEFYLSKCPESVKTRNDVFYLLPERSCVPDSPVWYSTSPLAKENLVKMLYRIKMVKEVNVAFLSN